MAYEVKRVNDSVYVFARWDETWKSYNNCYLLVAQDQTIMIDCGKAAHGEELCDAMRRLGLAPDGVSHLIATHGHADHVGAYHLFPRAAKYIHPADRALLADEAQRNFSQNLPGDGAIFDFDSVHVPHHTRGSVALFHRPTGTLFAGDHLCFFGEPLPAGGLVSTGPELRERARSFIGNWSRNEEDRAKYRFAEFIQGLRALSRFPALSFCTGHGGVLTGTIPEFLEDLLALDVPPAGNQP